MTDFANGGVIRPAGTDPGDDTIPVWLSRGCIAFPGAGGEPVEVGATDANGDPSPVEAYYGADFLRDLNAGRARFCDQDGPHGEHEWYDPALRWNCPGRHQSDSQPGETA